MACWNRLGCRSVRASGTLALLLAAAARGGAGGQPFGYQRITSPGVPTWPENNIQRHELRSVRAAWQRFTGPWGTLCVCVFTLCVCVCVRVCVRVFTGSCRVPIVALTSRSALEDKVSAPAAEPRGRVEFSVVGGGASVAVDQTGLDSGEQGVGAVESEYSGLGDGAALVDTEGLRAPQTTSQLLRQLFTRTIQLFTRTIQAVVC